MIIGKLAGECVVRRKMAYTRMRMQSIAETSSLVRQKKLSPVELTRACLDQIARLNPTVNAFITVMADAALEDAEKAEQEIQAGKRRGPLHGIPIGLKDIIDTAGVRTTAASSVFKDRVPNEDAEVTKRLRAAGAVLIGKQNLHEFAYGGSSLISHFGPVRNPVNHDFIAGGSSSGSAAAVACGMCHAAIGTDTAGSIRVPAALCGVVGFKPSYGLVSAKGVIPLSGSLDHVGPITQCVEDAAILLAELTGGGEHYSQHLQKKDSKFAIGIPRKYFFEDLDPEVSCAVGNAIERFKDSGATVREVEIPVSTDRTVQAAESYAYHRQMVTSSPQLYNPETLRRIRTGEKITPDQYQNALRELKKIRAEIGEFFRDINVLITPTRPIPTPKISELMQDPARMRPVELLLLRNTRPVNVWGLPAISVPCGITAEKLPIGLQIIGGPNQDAKVLQTAHHYQQISSTR